MPKLRVWIYSIAFLVRVSICRTSRRNFSNTLPNSGDDTTPWHSSAFRSRSDTSSFAVLYQNRSFVLARAAGLIVVIGGRLLELVSSPVLLPLLTIILVLSPIKVWWHN
jgi:hypothetical protein